MILSVQKKASRFSLKLFLSLCITILFSNCVVVSTTETNDFEDKDKSDIFLTSLAANSPADKPEFLWKEISDGIESCTFFDNASGSFCNTVKIELGTENLEIIASEPETDENSNTAVFKAETTKKFAQNNNTIVAINTTPFNYPAGRFSSKRTLAGVFIKNNVVYAPKAGRYSALIFFNDKNGNMSAKIIDSQNDIEPDDSMIYAFGGFWTIIKDNLIINFASQQKEPRTAAGLMNDGKTLIILTVDKSGSTSKGSTFNETSAILTRLGAQNAIMLDGGSSSSLVINGKQISKTFPHVQVALSMGFKMKKAEEEQKIQDN